MATKEVKKIGHPKEKYQVDKKKVATSGDEAKKAEKKPE